MGIDSDLSRRYEEFMVNDYHRSTNRRGELFKYVW